MLVVSANGVPVTANFTGRATFPTQGRWPVPMNKLDAFVNSTDVVFQLLTEETGWQDDQNLEVLMRMGFNSRDPLPPFYAVRFKVWSATLLASSGTIDVSAFQI